jgi:hypothetical protein
MTTNQTHFNLSHGANEDLDDALRKILALRHGTHPPGDPSGAPTIDQVTACLQSAIESLSKLRAYVECGFVRVEAP